jgi:hypothetical protein
MFELEKGKQILINVRNELQLTQAEKSDGLAKYKQL